MPTRPASILVVDDDREWLDGAVELLASAGHDSRGCSTFDEALQILNTSQPDLLIADIRLGEFNGLFLLLHTRETHTRMASLVVSGYADPVLEREARRYGAADFLVKPIDPQALLAKVRTTLDRTARRRWPRKDVHEDLAALVDGQAARIVNVSYGGVRLELPSRVSPTAPFEIAVPSYGVKMRATAVWSRAPQGEHQECGALLMMEGSTQEAWNRVVDALPN